MQTMEIKLARSEGNVVRMDVHGKVTRDGWPPNRDPIGDIFGEEVYSRPVLLNLSRSLYIDSTGVEWLLTCHRRFEERGGLLVLHSANPMTMQLLKMMRMDLVLNIVDDDHAALEFIKKKTDETQSHEQDSGTDSQGSHAAQQR